MSELQILTFLHVTFVVLAFGLMVFPGIVLQRIARSGDVAAIRGAYRLGIFHGRIGGMLLGIGVIFGFWTAVVAHFPLASSWLIVAYVAIVAILITGGAFHARSEMQILSVASSGRADAGDQCARLARSPAAAVVNVISVVAWLSVIFAMVVKP